MAADAAAVAARRPTAATGTARATVSSAAITTAPVSTAAGEPIVGPRSVAANVSPQAEFARLPKASHVTTVNVDTVRGLDRHRPSPIA